MSRAMRNPHSTATAFLAALLVCACSQSPSSTSVAHSAATKAQNGGSKTNDQGADPDLVSAVNINGTSSSLFTLKFKVETRPTVTTPLDIKILMIPAPGADITHLQMLFQTSDGLQLQSGRTVDLTDLSGGAPVEREVTVVPQKTGVFSLSATVLVDTATESISRTYAIPLIASDSRS
jgi:hypothetical protein